MDHVPRHSARSRWLLLAPTWVAVAACSPDLPPAASYQDGIFEGGVLSEDAKAARHYDSDLLPISSGGHSTLLPGGVATAEGTVRQLVIYSETYDLDGYYKSMVGPKSRIVVSAEHDTNGEPKLYWIKGISAEIVDEEGAPLSQEYTCHMVASMAAPEAHSEALGLTLGEPRFTALAGGFYHKEYPDGFGIPVLSSDPLAFTSQVLNFNTAITDEPLRLRHRIVVTLILDRDRRVPMKALRNTVVQVHVLLKGEEGEGYYGVRLPDPAVHGESCAVGDSAHAFSPRLNDAYGREFTPHWKIKPGPSENHTLVSSSWGLSYDTRIHSIDVHMHPFGEWIELRDITAGETIFRSEMDQIPSGIGLARIQGYRSSEGIPIYANHQYSLVSYYNNTTNEDQDAMASLYMGFHDLEFDPAMLHDPALRQKRARERRESDLAAAQRAVEQNPANAKTHLGLSEQYLRAGRYERAAEQLRIASEMKLEGQRTQEILRLLSAEIERQRGAAAAAPSSPSL